MKTIKEIENTKLEQTYLIVYALKYNLNIKKEEFIEKRDSYTFVGLNSQGKRKYLGTYIENKEEHRFWLDIFETWKKKGLKDVLFLSVDDNTYLKKCFRVSFPETNFVPFLLDIVDSFYKYFSDKFSTKIRTEIKKLYICDNLVDYKNNYNLFLEKYGQNQILLSMINKYLINIEDIYKYDKNIRKALFNSYSLKVIKNKIEKEMKEKLFIKKENDIIESMVEVINNLERNTSYTKREWLIILESFYSLFKERVGILL